jgi:hypothetical protein
MPYFIFHHGFANDFVDGRHSVEDQFQPASRRVVIPWRGPGSNVIDTGILPSMIMSRMSSVTIEQFINPERPL